MKNKKIHPAKFIIFAFIPLIILVLMAEAACRIKYFVMHKNWNFITAPFVVVEHQQQTDPAAWMPPAENQPQDGQRVIKWHKPCINREVFSEHYKKLMPYTYNEFCFRGDRIKLDKEPSEFRISVVGGSTVEDVQSDEEMWTMQLKLLLTRVPKNKIIKIINAGQSGYDSGQIFYLYQKKLKKFKPDLVLYYEAVNEQRPYNRFIDIDNSIGRINNKFHKLLHYKSMLYTYLVEKYSFMTVKQRQLWLIDLPRLKENLLALNREIKDSGTQMVFATQIMNAPKYFKEVDTFDYKAVSDLLNSLKNDPDYKYDTSEISALNQRLAVFYSIEICKEYGIPYINVLDEIESLGSVERNKLFCVDDPIHTTYEGNRLIAKLIGAKLNDLLKDR